MKCLFCLAALTILLLASTSCERTKDPVFRVDLITYIDNSYTECFEDCLRDGLKAAGLVEGADYRLRLRSAQGDMAMLTMLVDAAASARSDLLITFQAPTLYAAIQRAPKIKRMFTLLQNPFVVGAGESDTNHRPNLTGLDMVPPLEELLELIAQMVIRVICGEDPSTMPFENDRDRKKRYGFNHATAHDFKLKLPDPPPNRVE